MPSRNKKINRDFQIEGRRSVLEALKNPSRIEKLIISNSEKIGPQIEKILKTAKTLDISVDFVTKNQLDKIISIIKLNKLTQYDSLLTVKTSS